MEVEILPVWQEVEILQTPVWHHGGVIQDCRTWIVWTQTVKGHFSSDLKTVIHEDSQSNANYEATESKQWNPRKLKRCWGPRTEGPVAGGFPMVHSQDGLEVMRQAAERGAPRLRQGAYCCCSNPVRPSECLWRLWSNTCKFTWLLPVLPSRLQALWGHSLSPLYLQYSPECLVHNRSSVNTQ